jgi:hypothetical protein
MVLTLITSCETYPILLIPQIHVPKDYLKSVSLKPKKMDLSDSHLKNLKKEVTKKNYNFINSLMYNYYDNYYGLKICNIKLNTISKYLVYYTELTKETDNNG